MKILVIHYAYWTTGGPERYLFNIIKELEKRGHTVVPFSMNCTENKPTPYEKYFISPINSDGSWYFNRKIGGLVPFLKQTMRLFYSIEAKKKLSKLIEIEKPDIAYVLLFHKKLSPTVLTTCFLKKLPIVMRISDFLPMCPKMTFYRNGQICELCKKSKLYSIKYRCTKHSFFSSLLWYMADKFHHAGNIYGLVDTFILTNPFMKKKMLEYGYKGKYEVIESPSNSNETFAKPYVEKIKLKQFCYVGNIFEHKGVDLLIYAFSKFRVLYPEYKLVIMGNDFDTIIERLMRTNPELFDHIEYRKHSDKQAVLTLMAESMYSIIPVKWYENLPNAVIESYSVGTPVIATKIGSLTYMVENNFTGFTFEYGNIGDLVGKLGQAIGLEPDSYEQIQSNCMDEIKNKYSNGRHYHKLIKTFQQAVNQRSNYV